MNMNAVFLGFPDAVGLLVFSNKPPRSFRLAQFIVRLFYKVVDLLYQMHDLKVPCGRLFYLGISEKWVNTNT